MNQVNDAKDITKNYSNSEPSSKVKRDVCDIISYYKDFSANAINSQCLLQEKC
jgi:hypothetical protein